MIIKILLIVGILALLLVGLSSRNSYFGHAWKKILFTGLSLLVIASVIFPDSLTVFANFLGVGRGADLILYSLTLAFMFYVLNDYLYKQDQKVKIYKIARKLAIQEANQSIGKVDKNTSQRK